MPRLRTKTAYAITMWDFSWLERRWTGAGYEDWGRALDELAERGYNAVRIDAYPHLAWAGAEQEWLLKPVWTQQLWGSPAMNRVQLFPALIEFVAACRERGMKVALSSWYREDVEDSRMRLSSAEAMAEAWLSVLDRLDRADLMDAILWVDLCNEWPGDLWAPYFRNDPPDKTWAWWHTPVSMEWMRKSIAIIRAEYPQVPLCYSFDGMEDHYYESRDLSFFDLIEHHCWMMKENDGEFGIRSGYSFEKFEPTGFDNMAMKAEKLYFAEREHWHELLLSRIASLAHASRLTGLPLATTECWGIVDYKDWPLFDWGWVKELCEIGTHAAVDTKRWAAVSTSNFCGPQFVGMWRDVAWHQALTKKIRSTVIDEELT